MSVSINLNEPAYSRDNHWYEEAEEVEAFDDEKELATRMYHMLYEEACDYVVSQSPKKIDLPVSIDVTTFYYIYSKKAPSKTVKFGHFATQETKTVMLYSFDVDWTQFIETHKDAMVEAQKAIMIERIEEAERKTQKLLELLEKRMELIEKQTAILEAMQKQQALMLKKIEALERQNETLSKIIISKDAQLQAQIYENASKKLENEIVETKKQIAEVETKQEQTKQKLSFIQKAKNVANGIVNEVKQLGGKIVDGAKNVFNKLFGGPDV